VESEYYPNLYDKVDAHRRLLSELQQLYPGVKVPSIFEAINYWFTLRAQSDQFSKGGTYHLTHFRHFDLDEVKDPGGIENDWLYVPTTVVDDSGVTFLAASPTHYNQDFRISIG
jgi:hypothetical protein